MTLTRYATRAAAFFDVDGTLVNATTMFEFLAHHLDARGRPEEYPAFRNRLDDMARAGADRSQRCRAYYEMYEGVPVSSVAEEGARWFAAGPVVRDSSSSQPSPSSALTLPLGM
ncbi:haloacid dehalogenase-like hydrolase [Streptomyces kaempferi]